MVSFKAFVMLLAVASAAKLRKVTEEQQGPCMDMCGKVTDKTMQECEHQCTGDVVLSTGTSVLCLDMCRKFPDYDMLQCKAKCNRR